MTRLYRQNSRRIYNITFTRKYKRIRLLRPRLFHRQCLTGFSGNYSGGSINVRHVCKYMASLGPLRLWIVSSKVIGLKIFIGGKNYISDFRDIVR